MAEDPQERAAWDALVGRAVADDPVLTALDMGAIEGLTAEEADLFFRTVERALPTDEELREQSVRETNARMQQAGLDLRDLRAEGAVVSSHPWTDPWTDPALAYAKTVQRLGRILLVLLVTALVCGVLLGVAL